MRLLIALIAPLFFSFPYLRSHAQPAQITLPLNNLLYTTLNSTSPSPMTFILPATPSGAPLSISVALCSSSQPFPKFFVSNGSTTNDAGGQGTWQLTLEEGIGVWSGTNVGGRLVVHLGDGATGMKDGVWPIEVAVSNGEPLHRNPSTLPLLGDTTTTQALLFSPAFAPPVHTPPVYPNYTLPSGNLSLPDPPPPSAQTNTSLILIPVSQLQASNFSLFKSACAIKNAASHIVGSWNGANGTGGVNSSVTLFLRDALGWRSQWIMEGLTASTNYSAWVIQDGGIVGGPIYAFTKSSAFACSLVHSLPFCPLTSYAVPLPPPTDGTTSYTTLNLPSNISDPLISSLSNFTTSLLTFPCGRDVYSPLQSCEDCATAYRAWVCAVSLPRCGEIPLPLASSLASQPAATEHSQSRQALPTPAILSHPPAPARLQEISSYDELLPCIETCQAVDRACPPLFGWTCPHTTVNANWSYGVGFIDSWDGDQGEGMPGVAQDRWGVAWCNG